MENKINVEVLIIGGSYAGISAGLALGRALRTVLIIDNGKPCNRFTPHSHNFITHDGAVPADVSTKAKEQLTKYDTVSFKYDTVLACSKTNGHFNLSTSEGLSVTAKKLICAHGIRDIFPSIQGLEECWGKTVLHCPYCHGYEAKGQKTGILGNGDYAFDFSKLLLNWTKDLTVFTNGPMIFPEAQQVLLAKNNIQVIEKKISSLSHKNGELEKVVFTDGEHKPVNALYTRLPFAQHSDIPAQLGCEITETGHIKVDGFQRTSLPGVFACGDNSHVMRSISVAAAAGTLAGATANKELAEEAFGI